MPNQRHWIKIALLAAAPLHAHDAITTRLTWTQEISRLVYKHCSNCHREGGAAFNLTTLRDRLRLFRTIEEDGIVLKMDPREADLYGARALGLLKKAKAELSSRYDSLESAFLDLTSAATEYRGALDGRTS